MKVNTTGLVMIASGGEPAPGGGKFSGFGPWPSVGPVGMIAFIASVEGAPGPLGVYAWQAGVLRRIVLAGERLPEGGALASFAINAVTSAGPNGGVTFVTMGDPDVGGSRIYYFGPR